MIYKMRKKTKEILERINEIRDAIYAENISYGEIVYLQGVRYYIKRYCDDLTVWEWAGIKE